jgi:hypothetical protein
VQSNGHTKCAEKTQTDAKKKTIKYVERDEAEREAFVEQLSEIPEEMRVYVDETGKNAELDRAYGYAPRGEKVEGKTHGRKPERVNIVAAKCGNEMLEVHEYGCAMNSRLFEFWFMLLLKCVLVGSHIILDNARFHRRAVLQEMAEAAGCHVLFLPKYSPDLNPIELEWANLKSFLRNYGRLFDITSDAVSHYFDSA